MSITPTDLEQRLAAPGGIAVRDDLLARTRQLEQRLRGRIAQGLSREEFPVWQAAADAAHAAHEVLNTWPMADESPPAASAALFSLSSTS
ncbi:MAG: hypothetical protein JHC61_17105 [Burkholderiaceae bacterium]|nr:hypothetical protein [Burkholderiaceae bacterium]